MTTLRRKAFAADPSVLAEQRQVRVTCSTPEVGRDGIVLDSTGIDLTAYRTNPVVLWQHDGDQPIARAVTIAIVGEELQALVQFPAEGVSPKADEVYGLIRAGVINTVSTGFDPLETAPMDPKAPDGPLHILRCELLEFSFVSIPAVRGALITERSMRKTRATPDWRVGATRDLPIDEKMTWDGPAATERMFDAAGFHGDNPKPDADKAKRGFLVYDATAPAEKGSYKLPFADVIDGKLTAVREGIDDAASRLPQTDIPDDTRKDAESVIKDYEKADADDKPERAIRARIARGLVRRGLWDVSCLAGALEQLGWMHGSVAFEADIEQDGSRVPAMLGAALKQLGDVLIAMTEEEVAELLGGDDDDAAEMPPVPDEDAEYVEAAATPRLKRHRAGLAAGRRALGAVGRITPQQRRLRQRLAHLRRIAGDSIAV